MDQEANQLGDCIHCDRILSEQEGASTGARSNASKTKGSHELSLTAQDPPTQLAATRCNSPVEVPEEQGVLFGSTRLGADVGRNAARTGSSRQLPGRFCVMLGVVISSVTLATDSSSAQALAGNHRMGVHQRGGAMPDQRMEGGTGEDIAVGPKYELGFVR